ncbi:MAG TPA: hypothetical protein VF627_13535 [Abditibacterium sp.]|jgi:hypothetical protein
MNPPKHLGISPRAADFKLTQYINLKLAFLGLPTVGADLDTEFNEMIATLLSHSRETDRLLADYLGPADQRIQDYLTSYLEETGIPAPKLPAKTFVLDQPGLARALSLPPDRDDFVSDIVKSYRVKQGVLHNPKSDRRTTQGIFHVAEGGLPIPDDKRAVPKAVFGQVLKLALQPPPEMMQLPFTSSQQEQAQCWVSLLLRPLVCPAVPGYTREKTMEMRFFAPGNLASNLDFVESIFGNAGDPFLPENDAGLDTEHWTGHTGCVILAPHLVRVTKREVGLPHIDAATERQKRDRMCWADENELYNDGVAFKLTCRDERGVMVTIIADNYFGYCKKEVKTQISYAANLFGVSEEEHAGGALVFPSFDLGEEFSANLHAPKLGFSFEEVLSLYAEKMDLQPEGHAVDKQFPNIIYVPDDVSFDLLSQSVSWPLGESAGERAGEIMSIKLLPGKTYVRPSGYKVRMEKPSNERAWRLVGTLAEGTLCHKPSTVSGGGKSEISKPISDAIINGPVFVTDFEKDFAQVEALISRDYGDRFSDDFRAKFTGDVDSRAILSPERSLGSVIKLLTPASRDFGDAYNEWLESVPQHIIELALVVKRFYKPEWGDDWRAHFSVDIINGIPGNELKCDGRKLAANYLRVGYAPDGSWRVFGLRKDFHPATKWQFEDDITASVVVPSEVLSYLNPDYSQEAIKFVQNCEYRLFQRPDDAIHRGYDKQTEIDFAKPGNFFSNYEPFTTAQARELIEDAIGFDQWTAPMKNLIHEVAASEKNGYFVSSAHPRIVNGKPSANPRYLQMRPDLVTPQDVYLAEMGVRMVRRIPLGKPVHLPVNAVLPGRRNNPAEAGVRPLAVFNPIHYLELPELFMEFICSMTGKSPSTTGAGSEGALTKGPFNALPPILDLNDALVSYLLTGYNVFVTAANYVGPHVRVDHDVSLLVPEVWSRMSVQERDPGFLIRNNYLEKCEDFEFEGRPVMTSRLGYRITRRFVKTYFGRVFNHPHLVFTEEMLRPEKQDLALVVDGMDNIIETQKRVAGQYFADGSIEMACPPLKALLHIMRDDHFEGKDLNHPEIRALFTREALLSGDWYAGQLAAKRAKDKALWERHVAYLEGFLTKENYAHEAARLGLQARMEQARGTLQGLQG